MSEAVYTSETPLACGAGIPGCDCDRLGPEICDLLGLPRGTVNRYCECHDCYVCGEIDCEGHPTTTIEDAAR